jgi:hypothetical protein
LNNHTMDAADATAFVAHGEARRMRPITDSDELRDYAERGLSLPYIDVGRDAEGRLRATGHGHAGHDNEGRMPFVCRFLETRVLPMVDPEVNVTGSYRIELHDSYSYLPRATTYENALTFARRRDARESVALVPDPYHMADFGGLLASPDVAGSHASSCWESKSPVMIFAGSTTGSRDPRLNARIAACVWSAASDHARGIADFRITNVVQMSQERALADVPELSHVLRPFSPVREQLQHRFVVNIPGNTACWSRVPMVMSSASLMVDLRIGQEAHDMMWYSPMMAPGTHFATAATLEELPELHARLVGSPDRCKRMVANANEFAREYFRSSRAAAYLAHLLEAAASHSRP